MKVKDQAEEMPETFWRQYEEGIERLRQDPQAWADYAAEQEAEAGVLRDGIDLFDV